MKGKFSLATAIGAAALVAACDPQLPPVEKIDKVVYLDQGDKWDRDQYYTTAQGTVVLPVEWWFALEEPSSETLLSDKTLLSRFGMLTDRIKPGSADVKDRLPVGFTLQTVTQPSGNTQTVVGLSCAACHTGQLVHNGTAFRVDGGQSLTNFTLFGETVGKSIIATFAEPMKFKRFAQRVLAWRGEEYNEANKQGVRTELEAAVKQTAAAAATQSKYYPVEEGYGRLDALQRIANTLLGDDLLEPANYRPATAPVSFPHLWDAPFFDWVQWNGSVRQPMIRNVGEALGVKAMTNFVSASGAPNGQPGRWWTSIPVHDLHAIEKNLHNLKAPKWPAELGAIDPALAAKGRRLFEENCAECHGWAWWSVKDWSGKPVRLIQTRTVGAEIVGTDRTLLDNFNTRTYDASKLGWYDGKPPPAQDPGFNDDGTTYYPASKADPYGSALKSVNAGQGLFAVTQLVKANLYANLGVKAADWADYDGFGLPNEVRATCGYKARPLDGVWATPPFLHNGSVPTVYHLLSPPSERPSVFWVGNPEYDPKHLGHVWSEYKNGTRFDTSVTGNSNTGHAFSDTPGPGVIGRALSVDERMALIEYLKAMDPKDPVTRPVDPNADKDYPCSGTLPYYSNARK